MSAGQYERRLSPVLLATEPNPAMLARSSHINRSAQSETAGPESYWRGFGDSQHGSQQRCIWDILGELDEPDEPCPICSPAYRHSRSLVRSQHNVDPSVSAAAK